ncbi:precorrin-3B synthase [Actinacidiphila sp. bgisy160]|uniref:precorrin-3B synthase n=1 Tax=Actinacidiphila sp. bgisy160 TaxID=3413796 RepID=UPI003D731899
MPSPSDPPVSGAFAAATAGRARDDACPGALRLHTADDGALARIRIPGGLLTVRQAEAVAVAADRLGDGRIDLTSRGNLQLRGLRDPGAGTELAALLGRAGLLPSWAHERARNVVASPLAGLDGRSHGDLRGWIRELDALLCASAAAAGLSGRFLFALDDGRGDTAALGGDVALIARPDAAAAELRLAGRPVAQVPAGDAPRWAVRAAEGFLTLAAERGARAWRIADVDPAGTETAARLRAAGAPPAASGPAADDTVPDTAGGPPLPGLVRHPDGTTCALSAGVRLGRLTTRAWRLLARVAGSGAGELRVTPWRGVVLPGLPPSTAQEATEGLTAAGFLTGEDSPWRGVTACAGRPGCAKSLADVRTDARAALREAAPEPGHRLLPVHFSGCERRCGHPDGSWVDVVAGADGRYRVAVAGAVRGVTAATAATAATATDLPAALDTARRTSTPPPSRTT